MVKVKEVFVAGGMPKLTYIDREHLKLEKKLRDAIDEGYQLVCVTGPTKSGKTVLCRQVIGEKNFISVPGGQIYESGDFWKHIVDQLDIPSEVSFSDTDRIGGGLAALIKLKAESETGEAKKIAKSSRKFILDYLKDNEIFLIVDDFHYMPKTIQKEVVRSLKSEIFEGLEAVLIAAPHHAFAAIGVEKEMEGRYAHVEIPTWDEADLAKIARKGFPRLKVEISDSLKYEFASESFGSPLLMQRFCGRLCLVYDIRQTLKEKRQIKPTKITRQEIYNYVAHNFGFTSFSRLSKGPQQRADRLPRRLKGQTKTVDLYEAILIAVANTGPKEKLSYTEIRSALQDTLN